MERIEYFGKPAQVKFRDFKGEECYGIAFKDTIICGCCGSAFEAGEVEIIEEFKYWVPLDVEIKGD